MNNLEEYEQILGRRHGINADKERIVFVLIKNSNNFKQF
jgi:hypothetical protein